MKNILGVVFFLIYHGSIYAQSLSAQSIGCGAGETTVQNTVWSYTVGEAIATSTVPSAAGFQQWQPGIVIAVEESDWNHGLWTCYPNPTQGAVCIVNLATKGNYTIKLMDAQSRQLAIYSVFGRCDLDLSRWPNGCYYALLIASDNSAQTVRIIKAN